MNAFIQELFRAGLYKKTQGRIARQATFAAIMAVTLFGLFQLVVTLGGWEARPSVQFGIPAAIAAVTAWAAYRLVNVPFVADFLIAVEAEMRKVSWPTKQELFRSCIVVLVTIFVLATVLSAFDLLWRTIFWRLGVI